MIETTSEYSILLSGLTAEHTREGLLSTYENVMKVTSLKLFQYFEEKEKVTTRLALFQVQDPEEACRAAIRYNQNIQSSLHVTKLMKDSKAVSSMSDMITLNICFNSFERELNLALLALLRSFGEIKVVSMECSNGANHWVFKVKPSYSIHPICTGEVFQFRGAEIHAKYEDLEMSAYYFKEMGFELSELHKKFKYEEGLEIILDSVLVRAKPKSRESTNPGSQRVIGLSQYDDFDDSLEDIYEEDSDSTEEYGGTEGLNEDGLSFFRDTQNLAFAFKHTGITAKYEPLTEGRPATRKENMALPLAGVQLRSENPRPDYQQKISTLKKEIIRHSGELKESILEEIEMKIDPSLPLEEQKKIEAKILKTKLRKSKRKERKKEERAELESNERYNPNQPSPLFYSLSPPALLDPSSFAHPKSPGPPPYPCSPLYYRSPQPLQLQHLDYRSLADLQQATFYPSLAPRSLASLNCKEGSKAEIDKPPLGRSRHPPIGIQPFTTNHHAPITSKSRYPHAGIYPT